MDALLIQLKHQKALQLLQDLEELQLIRVLKINANPKRKLSDKYAEKLPSEVAEQMQ
ncbi:MAG: hypothetical protein SFU99_22385 [Saprospiraceae bacterium]|nr:hypothetical protein [Saprospiraceae bacterium]